MKCSWEGIVASLRSGAGDSLRTVARFAPTESVILYARTDVPADYDDSTLEDIGNDLVLESLASTWQESLYELGDLDATVRIFDEGTVVAVPVSERKGYLASVDEHCPLPVRDIVARIQSAQPGRVVKS